MSEGNRSPRSVAGDKVQMAVEVVHEMNLKAVFVAFRHETDERVEVMLMDDDPPQREPLSGLERRTVWAPTGLIGPEHIPGVYTLHRINLITAADRVIRLDAEEHLANRPLPRIRVVEEPESTPYFGTVEFQYDR